MKRKHVSPPFKTFECAERLHQRRGWWQGGGPGGSDAVKLPISPLVGEMSGRTEGGAVPPAFRII
ncbi:MAG: hypothetical protein EOR94_08945 [Mesorhizobium sp.]|nr:MAG: hypothetical protein EOR94_08945 [Mesorhizobium sp.]